MAIRTGPVSYAPSAYRYQQTIVYQRVAQSEIGSQRIERFKEALIFRPGSKH